MVFLILILVWKIVALSIVEDKYGFSYLLELLKSLPILHCLCLLWMFFNAMLNIGHT